MTIATPIKPADEPQRMADVLARQKAAHIRDGSPSAEIRIGRLDRGIGMLVSHHAEIVRALNDDFGSRAADIVVGAAILVGLVALSLFLRTRAIHVGYWIDEGLSVGLASFPLTDIPGVDNPAIIAAQGTMGIEILQDVPDADAVIVPVGGAGLLAGVALAITVVALVFILAGLDEVSNPQLRQKNVHKSAFKSLFIGKGRSK